MITNRSSGLCVTILLLVFFFFSSAKAAENERIGLQNPDDRTIVYCYSGSERSAEQCASYYEKKGYVRLRDLPNKPASYDILTVDTYPTRRWRSGELTPRW